MTSTSHQSDREPARPPSAGRRVWWALAGMFRFVGRVLRGLIAGTVLLALVAGLPWALWHYIGWPLPNHVPTWAEVQGVLLGPMTTTFLLNFLACLCWITWAAFTIDVLRCTVDLARSGFDAARLPDFSAAGPVHALAGVLVGAVLLAVLGNRPAPAPVTSLSTALGTESQVVATAPAWQHQASTGEGTVVRNAVYSTQTTTKDSTATAPAHPESVVVLAPQNGVHDSLWRIAERTLGDGARWPEIFDLNKGKPQPNGHSFTKPSLIFPGEELALPREASAPAVPPQQPADPHQTTPAPPTTAPPTSAAPPTSIQPSTPAQPAPSTQQTPPAATSTNTPPATGDPGVRWGTELFVGLGLAAAVSAALMVARRRYRSRYRPGSGDRDDLPVAPVVYQLRLAHLRAEADDEIDLDEDYPDDEEQRRSLRVPPAPPLVVGAPQTGAGRPPTVAPGLGVRDGREVALDLATARGLGLVGAGAPAAARALLVTALTTSAGHLATSTGAVVIVPADDLVSLLGRGAAQGHLPSAVRIVADLDDALDAVEAETLVRASASRKPDAEPGTWPPLVLVARPPAHHQRLQAVLDNGAPFGVTGLLLGQWQPGVTCYIRQDGTISATGPGLGEPLRGTRMFRLGDDDTAELLTLLRDAEPDPPVAPDDVVVAPSTPRPRIVKANPAGSNQTSPGEADLLKTGGSDAGEVELEVTAAVTAPAPPDTELEILAPADVQPPGVRLRPAASSGQRPVPSRLANDETEHRGEDEADEPAPTCESAMPVDETPPTTISGAEQDTSPALITVTVLGDLRVHWHPEPGATGDAHEITGTLQPRTKELLVLLALHPDGATRETLVSALWGQDPPARPTNALHTALSRMRSALATATNGTVTDIVSASNGRYRLDPASVRSDYWRFAHAVAARRAASTDQARVEAYREMVNSYGGPLAEGMSNEWIEPAREAIRRDAIDAVAALARALVDSDPQQTLDLLEVARAFDPHNELLYRDIMRLQERLGQLDAIPRTLTLLTTRLAEVDATPTPQARGLAARLEQRHEGNSADDASAQAQGERGRIAAS
ncbi:BTAD domain-containing putative transcriptional regulator [Haloechinothrix salitolerans]|uniref:BTAD domain-containing putative transcriptional regulator n=1 Tax=Haloechinothrix salitolerans TaxID=926830 RepID=UPI0035E89F62